MSAITTRSYQTGLGALTVSNLGAEFFNAGDMECTFSGWESWVMEEIFPARNGGFQYPVDVHAVLPGSRILANNSSNNVGFTTMPQTSQKFINLTRADVKTDEQQQS